MNQPTVNGLEISQSDDDLQKISKPLNSLESVNGTGFKVRCCSFKIYEMLYCCKLQLYNDDLLSC